MVKDRQGFVFANDLRVTFYINVFFKKQKCPSINLLDTTT